MRLFICGDRDREFIESTLDDLNDKFNITSICGSAVSRCMDTVVPWAEYNNIPITLYLPEELNVSGMIALNNKIIRKEKPYMVMLYKENEEVAEKLLEHAYNDSSVEYVVKEIK